jgi:molybdate transport system regulatory protein
VKVSDVLGRHVSARSKVWLEADGSPVIGSGRASLLRAVDRTGSINAAAKELGMDYRRAWGLIDSMEKRLKVALLIRRRGGPAKGTSLTAEARTLLTLYERLDERTQRAADLQFTKIFKGPSKENKS